MPAQQQVDYAEVEGTSASIGAGASGPLEIDVSALPTGRAICRVHEIVCDSALTDFDVELFEDVALSQLNRVFRVVNVNLHRVDILGAGDGAQYRDRDVVTETQQAEFHFQVTNNTAGAGTVTVRVRYQVYFAR